MSAAEVASNEGIGLKTLYSWRNNDSGARLLPACAEVGVNVRTYRKWQYQRRVTQDKRVGATIIYRHRTLPSVLLGHYLLAKSYTRDYLINSSLLKKNHGD